MDDDNRLEINLNEVWHSCRKIQTTIFRYGFNVADEFAAHDPNCIGLVSKSIFSSLLGKYKAIVGLSDYEIREVTDYFSLRDGRVAYRQFCKVVCNETIDKGAPKDIASGLEWNDPYHVNILPRPEDRRRLCLILIKISQYTYLPLLPYFQDYELVTQNNGAVTVAHFARVLHFMKIPLSDSDFLLLLNRYMKDSYLVNYVAFTRHLNNIQKYLKDNRLTDTANIILESFPGRLVDLELPKLPPVDGTQLAKKIFRDDCNHPKDFKDQCELVICLQNLVHKNRIRVREFIEGFDHLRTGTITVNQFHRGLFNMGVGRFLTQNDFKTLCERYADPIDRNRVKWRVFEDEIDAVFTVKHLEKTPTREVHSPPQYIKDIPREGKMNWNSVDEVVRDLCEDTLTRIQNRIRNRRLHLHPFFRNYDKLNSGHVRCGQANQVFLTNGILLSEQELKALHDRYGNELGFNYAHFMRDADPALYAIPKLKQTEAALLLERCAKPAKDELDDSQNEEYIIKLLSKAKSQAIVRSLNIMEFMQDFDRHREGEILESDFRRALDNSNVHMTPREMDTLCKIFRSPKRACCVLYRDFCNALDEIFVEIEQTINDNEVTAVPLIHLANLDCVMCFLNFDERTLCSQALMKLARKPDEISNLSSVMKDFDREQCGTIRRNQLERALTVRDMNYMLSSREFDAVYKCFGVQRGLDLEFNYREFLNILNVLYRTGQVKRNY